MASKHHQDNKHGRTWRILWRPTGGKQRSRSFPTEDAADRFKNNLERLGPDEAIRISAAEEAATNGLTLTEWLTEHVDHLTGVQAATLNRYRAYITNDITPHIGSIRLTAVSESVIARWVQNLTAGTPKTDKEGNPVLDDSGQPKMVKPSRKTLQNKHAFVSGALKAAVKAGHIATNPCDDRRLPETLAGEMVFLTPDEFRLVHDSLRHPRWQAVATWLVLTGMRFSEATALTANDIDPVHKTARVWRAWKYSGNYRPELGPPKTRMGTRTISLPDAALAIVDLNKPEYLFTNGIGNRLSAQEFFQAWRPARELAQKNGLRKSPRVHDLRHTCASWLIQAGVPLPVIQQQLGHESIKTTVDRYGHLDRRNAQAAAMALDAAIGTQTRKAITG